MTSPEPEEIQPVEGEETLSPHRGKLIFLLGILGIIPLLLLAGLPAFLLGKADLAKMEAGTMDGAGRNQTSMGRTLGMISLPWTAIVVLVLVLFGGKLFGAQEAASAPRAGAKGVNRAKAAAPGPAPTAGPNAAAAGPAGVLPGPGAAPSNPPALPAGTAPAPPAVTVSASDVMPMGPGGVYGGAKEPIRPDPFISQWAPPAPKPKLQMPVLPAILNETLGLRVQQINISKASLRRTAGLVWNGSVYGLLEMGGETYIVRPGDKVGDYTVSAITRNAIVLYNAELKKFIEIPLQGTGAERPETQLKGAPVTSLENLPAASAAGPGGGSSPSPSPSDGFAPALPGF
jgi:hypothetical protein